MAHTARTCAAPPHSPRSQKASRSLRIALTARRERRKLAGMDAHMLADLGLTRGQAEAEARRPLWDVPANWRA